MDSSVTGQLVFLIILLLLSSFFSASETALMSLSKIRLRHMLEEKITGADVISRLVENPSRMLGAILVGNNIVNIGASALATSLAINYFGSAGVGIATAIMTVIVLIFGEITPKSLAAEKSEKVALKVSVPISHITTILRPFVGVLMIITNRAVRILGGKVDKKQPFITEEEIRTLVNVGHEEGILEGGEKKMIYNIFEFGDSQVKDVMTPRIDMVAIEIDTPYEEIIKKFKTERFSRFPVYKNIIDNIVGVLYLKDLLFFEGSKEDFNIFRYIREPYFTFEFKRTAELFEELRNRRIPIAIVLDEYGGTAGIITMEDLVEEIVGDINDEYDEQVEDIEVISEDEFLVHGSTKIETLNEMIGTNIETEDFESIGGFVVGVFGRIPQLGDSVQYNAIKFIVENVDKNRIRKLRIIT